MWTTESNFYYIETKGYTREKDFLKWQATRDQGFTLEVWKLKEIEKEEKNNGLRYNT